MRTYQFISIDMQLLKILNTLNRRRKYKSLWFLYIFPRFFSLQLLLLTFLRMQKQNTFQQNRLSTKVFQIFLHREKRSLTVKVSPLWRMSHIIRVAKYSTTYINWNRDWEFKWNFHMTLARRLLLWLLPIG